MIFIEPQSDHCLPLSLTQAVSHCVSSFKLIGTILVLHDDMIGQRSYFGKSTQPSGPLCLWQCLRSYLQEMVARVVISGIPLHSIVAMVVREGGGPVPSVGATHHLNKLNVSRELGFRVTSCLPSILYIAYKELAFSSFVSDDTSLPKPVGRCRRHK